ncbi:MAG: hypothetical protein FWG25_03750 [Promicromonosporaceae bacterium]|nr:hypothetical protein [Promicromonosporaceae bacterium]
MDSPTLQDLVRSAISQRPGISIRALASEARDNGYRISYSNLQDIANGNYKAEPRASTIKAIAWLAGVTEEAAFASANPRHTQASPNENAFVLALVRETYEKLLSDVEDMQNEIGWLEARVEELEQRS